MNIENVRESFKLLDQGIKGLAQGPADYYLQTLVDCYDLLIERFAPAHVGDTVRLLRTPVITQAESWGWLGAKHFLVEGAPAEVVLVECDRKGFSFGMKFEADSWLKDGKRVLREPAERQVFFFRESEVERVSGGTKDNPS